MSEFAVPTSSSGFKTAAAQHSGGAAAINVVHQPPIDKSHIQRLSTDVVLGYILPYIRNKKMLATLATVSKHFEDILFSLEAEHIWNDELSSFHLCIDTYCTSCLMKKLQRKGSHLGSIGFLRKFPISRLKLHCFVTDIPDCMLALSSRKYLKALDLTLTNKTNSPPLEDLLGTSSLFLEGIKEIQNQPSVTTPTVMGRNLVISDNYGDNKGSSLENIIADDRIIDDMSKDSNDMKISIEDNCSLFPELRELTLDSCHLAHVNLAGRAKLLDILGENLESLTFSGLSPTGN